MTLHQPNAMALRVDGTHAVASPWQGKTHKGLGKWNSMAWKLLELGANKLCCYHCWCFAATCDKPNIARSTETGRRQASYKCQEDSEEAF